MDKYLYFVDSVHISGCLAGHTHLAYLGYAKYVRCDDVNTFDTTNREIAAQQYLTALLLRGLNKQRFAQLK